jgi:hypothetical protein
MVTIAPTALSANPTIPRMTEWWIGAYGANRAVM